MYCRFKLLHQSAESPSPDTSTTPHSTKFSWARIMLTAMLRATLIAAAACSAASASSAANTTDRRLVPALYLIERNFGQAASTIFDLTLLAVGEGCGDGVKAPCFSIVQTGERVAIAATAMSELTYGIG